MVHPLSEEIRGFTMHELTKRIFRAPWIVDTVTLNIGGEYVNYYRIFDAKSNLVAPSIATKAMANRIAHLPELFDLVLKAASFDCFSCYFSKEYEGTPPTPESASEDFVDGGCEFPEQGKKCENKKTLELLKRIRNGK